MDTKNKYYYLLKWVEESNRARQTHRQFVNRVDEAILGHPYINSYEENAKAMMRQAKGEMRDYAQMVCNSIPKGDSNILERYAELAVANMGGGYKQFEYTINDKYNTLAPEDNDRVASFYEHLYNDLRIEKTATQAVRSAIYYGGGYVYVYPKKDKELKLELKLLNSTDMLLDPSRFNTTEPRYIGFTELVTTDQLESVITTYKKRLAPHSPEQEYLKTLNDMDFVYKTNDNQYTNNIYLPANALSDNFKRDIEGYYNDISTTTDNPKDPKVELTYIFDHTNKKLFTILNRLYVVKEENFANKTVNYQFDFMGETHKNKKKIDMPCPIVELPYRRDMKSTYPTTPMAGALVLFDQYCSWNSIYRHNTFLTSLMTFVADSQNAEELQKMLFGSGVILTDIDDDVQVLQKPIDMNALVLIMQKIETELQETLNSYPAMAQSQMTNDRASARESMNLQHAISQGSLGFIKNIELFGEELMKTIVKMKIVYGEEDFSFQNNNRFDLLTVEDLALDGVLTMKTTMAVQIAQNSRSANALQLLSSFGDPKYINQKELMKTLMPIALSSNVISQSQAQALYQDPEHDEAMKQAIQDSTQNITNDLADQEYQSQQYPFDTQLEKLQSELSPEELKKVLDEYNKVSYQDATSNLPPTAEAGGYYGNEYQEM